MNIAQSMLFRAFWHFYVVMTICGIFTYNIFYITKNITFVVYVLSMISNSVLILLVFGGLEIFKSCKFSGVPFMNKVLSDKQEIIRNVSLFLIYGEIVDLFLYGFLLTFSLVLNDSIEDLLTQNNPTGIIFFVFYTSELFFNEILPSYIAYDEQYIRSFEMSGLNSLKESLVFDEEDDVIPPHVFDPTINNEAETSIFDKRPMFDESLKEKIRFESLRKGSREELMDLFATIRNDSSGISNVKNRAYGDSTLKSFDSRMSTSFEKSYWVALGSKNLVLNDLQLRKEVIQGTVGGNSLGKCYIGHFKGYDVN